MALPPDLLPLGRGFANTSFRYLFRQRDNVADLVRWLVPSIAPQIDFSRLQVQPDTFITPGFSELESDVLLQAPWQGDGADEGAIQVFILIEHQSEPDELAVFRAMRYVMQVYDRQEKHWLQSHSNTRGLRFDPVLPIVFYSGTRTWDQLLPMHDLVHHSDRFGTLIPQMKPVFVNLAETDPEVLHNQAGIFGWVLFLIQQKRQQFNEFREALRQMVTALEQVSDEARGRWIHLLWFAVALVYHAREEPERRLLVDFIRATVRETNQPEVEIMGKTIAEAIFDEGELKGKSATLLRQIKRRFKKVSPAILAEIETTEDSQLLDDWLDAFATAKKITDIPFKANKKK